MAELTTVRLLSNVDITKDYNNTFSFSTATAQTNFFIGKSQHTFQNLTYQRKEKAIKVEENIENLYNINYLMFQNAEFSNKWFYAFVVDMRYINEVTTEITFEIDVLQTWYFEMDMRESFVEREHVKNDTIGEHLLDENLDIGDPIIRDQYQPPSIGNLTYVLMTSVDADLNDVLGDEYAGMYSGLKFYANDDITYINNVITQLNTAGKGDALIAIFAMPKNLCPVVDEAGGDYAVEPSAFGTYEFDEVAFNTSDLDGYTPRNNKLYTFPYNYLEVTNHQGDSKVYKQEYFSGVEYEFSFIADISPGATVIMEPLNYNGVASNDDEFMTLGPYPLSVWKYDVYANWLAQNQVANAVKVGGSALSFLGGVATGNPIAIGGGVLGVASSIGQFKDKSVLPDQQRGQSSGTSSVAAGLMNFSFIKKTIRDQYARMIDEYFDKFGYKVNRVKTPNITGRANWNYVKLRAPNIFGDIPNKDLEKINSVFENGITYWHSDNVGNYSLSNGIV